MNETLSDVTTLYEDILLKVEEVIGDIKNIEANLRLSNGDISLYQKEIEHCKDSYFVLQDLIESESEFFTLLNKKNEINLVINSLYESLLHTVNIQEEFDFINEVSRKEVINWVGLVKTLFISLKHSLVNNDIFIEDIKKIDSLLFDNKDLLMKNQDLKSLNFIYIYPTKKYVSFLIDSLNLLSDIQLKPLEDNVLFEVADTLSEIPSVTYINDLFLMEYKRTLPKNDYYKQRLYSCDEEFINHFRNHYKNHSFNRETFVRLVLDTELISLSEVKKSTFDYHYFYSKDFNIYLIFDELKEDCDFFITFLHEVAHAMTHIVFKYSYKDSHNFLFATCYKYLLEKYLYFEEGFILDTFSYYQVKFDKNIIFQKKSNNYQYNKVKKHAKKIKKTKYKNHIIYYVFFENKMFTYFKNVKNQNIIVYERGISSFERGFIY